MISCKSNAIKCLKCRTKLIDDISLITNQNFQCDPQKCNSYDIKKVIYLMEDKLPEWIKSRIENEQWTKGRLNCEKCSCRIGSFDYISGRKCECGETVLPPVHFTSSQVDRPILSENALKLNKSNTE